MDERAGREAQLPVAAGAVETARGERGPALPAAKIADEPQRGRVRRVFAEDPAAADAVQTVPFVGAREIGKRPRPRQLLLQRVGAGEPAFDGRQERREERIGRERGQGRLHFAAADAGGTGGWEGSRRTDAWTCGPVPRACS